jgi:chromosome partitioning protein
MRTILVLNAKGGCGKSTLATNLAAWYANQGKFVVLADFDPQGSSLEWLAARSDRPPTITGLAAHREPFRVPARTDVAILDAPARTHGKELTALVKRAQTVLIPVLPSPTDMRAAAHFIHEVLVMGRVEREQTRLGIVANRVRSNTTFQDMTESVFNGLGIGYATPNTQMYDKLERFLRRLKIPMIASLRDAVVYSLADDRGLGIHELPPLQAGAVLDDWTPLLHWLESKKSLPRAS